MAQESAWLQVVPEDRLAEASLLTANAMIDTSSYAAIYQGDRLWRRDELAWLFEANFRIVRKHFPEAIKCHIGEDGVMQCCFMILPADYRISLWDKLWHGLLLLPLRAGFDTLGRLMAIGDFSDGLNDAAFGDRQRLRLERMAVHPSCQGKGIGTKSLGEALKEADALGLPVTLGTNEEINVRFYSKLGFQVVSETEYAPGTPEAFPTWIMVREPASSS